MTLSDLKSTPIPVTIVAGFLGAGKTTLLNHILSAEHGRRIGVLVNDFGSINVDAELITQVEDGMMTLANRCVCCSIRTDLFRGTPFGRTTTSKGPLDKHLHRDGAQQVAESTNDRDGR